MRIQGEMASGSSDRGAFSSPTVSGRALSAALEGLGYDAEEPIFELKKERGNWTLIDGDGERELAFQLEGEGTNPNAGADPRDPEHEENFESSGMTWDEWEEWFEENVSGVNAEWMEGYQFALEDFDFPNGTIKMEVDTGELEVVYAFGIEAFSFLEIPGEEDSRIFFDARSGGKKWVRRD